MNHLVFAALINQINSHLNEYLNKYRDSYLLKEDQYRKGWTDINGIQRSYIAIQFNDDQYLAFKYSSSCRNSYLSLERIKNIYKIQNNLISLLKNASPDTTNYSDLVQNTKKILEKGLLDNNMLSDKYHVVHHSYQQNRLLGMGMFSSWWNKSFCQSRAAVALEKSLDNLHDVAKNYSLNLSANGGAKEANAKPPAYPSVR